MDSETIRKLRELHAEMMCDGAFNHCVDLDLVKAMHSALPELLDAAERLAALREAVEFELRTPDGDAADRAGPGALDRLRAALGGGR